MRLPKSLLPRSVWALGHFRILWTFRGWPTTSSTCCLWARNHSRSLTAIWILRQKMAVVLMPTPRAKSPTTWSLSRMRLSLKRCTGSQSSFLLRYSTRATFKKRRTPSTPSGRCAESQRDGRFTVCSVRCWASIQPIALRSVISILWRTKIPANYTPPRLSFLSSITRRIWWHWCWLAPCLSLKWKVWHSSISPSFRIKRSMSLWSPPKLTSRRWQVSWFASSRSVTCVKCDWATSLITMRLSGAVSRVIIWVMSSALKCQVHLPTNWSHWGSLVNWWHRVTSRSTATTEPSKSVFS